jgi:hypothetical protein
MCVWHIARPDGVWFSCAAEFEDVARVRFTLVDGGGGGRFRNCGRRQYDRDAGLGKLLGSGVTVESSALQLWTRDAQRKQGAGENVLWRVNTLSRPDGGKTDVRVRREDAVCSSMEPGNKARRRCSTGHRHQSQEVAAMLCA